MKTKKTYQLADKNFNVEFATAIPSGYGHKKISVELIEENTGESQKFTATTDCMPYFDQANEKEGQEKYEAFFELIDRKIEDEVSNWLNEI